MVDSRWLQVPPDGTSRGPAVIDFLQPGGIYRDVTLRVVPEVFLSDVFARPLEWLLELWRRREDRTPPHPPHLTLAPASTIFRALSGQPAPRKNAASVPIWAA